MILQILSVCFDKICEKGYILTMNTELTEKLTKQIKSIGLNDKESAVYATLLELGGAFPSKVSSITGIKRSTVYKVLLDLSIKGIVNGIEKRNKLFYQADKPEKLVRYARDRVRMAEDDLEKAERALPELSQIFAMSGQKPKVTFFEGKDVIKLVCDDLVSEKYDEMLAFSNASKFKNSISPSDLRDFIKAKEKLNITLRAIVPDTEGDRNYNQDVFVGIKKNIWPRLKFIPKEVFNFDAELTIYGKNKVAITKLGNEHLIGVIIEDFTIYQMMKMIFELAWQSAKE